MLGLLIGRLVSHFVNMLGGPIGAPDGNVGIGVPWPTGLLFPLGVFCLFMSIIPIEIHLLCNSI